MSPHNGKELPGFYRDPISGRYYRETGDVPTSAKLTELKQSAVKEQVVAIKKKPKPIHNTLTYLRDRELYGVRSILSYYGMKLANKSLKSHIDLNKTGGKCPDIAAVDFIKRGPGCIYGMWERSEGVKPRFAIAQIPLNDVAIRPANISFHLIDDYIADITENMRSLHYVFNDPQTKRGTQMLIWDLGVSTERYKRYRSDTLKTTYFSCTHIVEDEHGPRVAMGCSDSVIEYLGLTPRFTLPVSGNVHTVCYDTAATTLLYGTNNGEIGLIDLTVNYENDVIPVTKLSGLNYCVVDAYFLTEDKVIIAGLPDKLEIIDLRKKQTVTTFLGHHGAVKKRGISVANDLVCITGEDNIIRIWHTSGGKPVHEIMTGDPENPTKIRGCLSSDHKGTYLHYFEANSYKIYEIDV